MQFFSIGQKVKLSYNPEIIFVITRINLDRSYQIQYACSVQNTLSFDYIPAEMLRLVNEDQLAVLLKQVC